MKLPKILYVDDEIINLELLQLTFMNDLEVITATSAADGLRILDANPDILYAGDALTIDSAGEILIVPRAADKKK